jgi:hypothetical protein
MHTNSTQERREQAQRYAQQHPELSWHTIAVMFELPEALQ